MMFYFSSTRCRKLFSFMRHNERSLSAILFKYSNMCVRVVVSNSLSFASRELVKASGSPQAVLLRCKSSCKELGVSKQMCNIILQ